MSESGLVRRAREWLSSTQHVQVPRNWLEACVDWVVQESRGAPVTQTRLNQQALEQWLYTDLRVLAHPVLPALGGALKTELSGSFCVQMDSALDVSRPAYSQLRERRGTDCGNETVSAATQASQRPWEAAPARVLMLQLTDGVQELEALEYRPVPALNADLPPGTKLLLQGRVECRLGVLLLTPANVRVLGGAVEELRDVLSQSRVLARVLGLPEEERGAGEAPAVGPGPRDEGVSDEELLASLEATTGVADSGYGSRNERPRPSPAPQRSLSPAPQRSLSPTPQRSVAPSADLDEDFDDLPLDELDSVVFLDDSDPVVMEESDTVEVEPRTSGAGCGAVEVEPDVWKVEPDMWEVEPEPMEVEPRTREVWSGPVEVEPETNGLGLKQVEAEPRTWKVGPGSVEVEPKTRKVGPKPVELEPRTNGMGRGPVGVGPGTWKMGAGSVELEPRTNQAGLKPVEVEPKSGAVPLLGSVGGGNRDSVADRVCTVKPQSRAGTRTLGQGRAGEETPEAQSPQGTSEGGANTLAMATDLVTPPFTYLSVLARGGAREARVKAFIITLQGSLRSTSGGWQVSATVSDGTGYLDVRLSDRVLAGLIGFSVAESRALRKDPARQHLVPAGLQRCQRELVDMCCLMTLQYDPVAQTGTVLSADPVTADTCRELEERVRSRNRR